MEMLCFDQKIDAEEAKQRGLVTNVFPYPNFKGECMSRLNLFASKPATTLEATKRLIRQGEMKQMLKLSISFVNTFALLSTNILSFECLFALCSYSLK